MGRRKLALLVTAALGVLAASAVLAGGAAGAGSTTIKLGDNFFKPSSKTISKGTKVRFKWIGTNKHNVVKTKGPGGGFQSETTNAPGVHFTKKFKKAGTYKMICSIHPEDMKLKIKVR